MYVGGLRFDTVEAPTYDTRPELRQARPAVARLRVGARLGDLDRPTPTRPMSRRASEHSIAVCLVAPAVALAGCTNPDAPSAGPSTTSTGSPQNAGEPPAPAPCLGSLTGTGRRAAARRRRRSRRSPALLNWTYRTLTLRSANARRDVGRRRAAGRAAGRRISQADTTIARGHIYNSGQIVSIAGDLAQPGTWVIVTREQTGGARSTKGCRPPTTSPSRGSRTSPAATR